jgi:thiamine-monophosphate kinase
VKVSEIGEFGLIDLLAEMADAPRDNRAASWRQLLIGIGDDAAAWQCTGSVQVATVDSLVQGVHFPAEVASWSDLGWKALAVNLSDIAAMGALPRYGLVALTLPGDTEVASVTELYRGLLELAQTYGVAVIGGNISRAPLLSITITVLGETGPDNILLTRGAARVGDLIAVTGSLGAAAAGLKMVTGNLKFDPLTAEALRRAFYRPNPRVGEGRLLVESGVKTAIDLSDGLVADLEHVCRASQLGARIELDQVPVAAMVREHFGEQALELALTGGEDYEMLFTASTEVIAAVKAKAACPVTVVGQITSRGGVALYDGSGQRVDYAKKGWEHFAAG